jgi:uncharacterized repeat protein (TIGR01451 family)
LVPEDDAMKIRSVLAGLAMAGALLLASTVPALAKGPASGESGDSLQADLTVSKTVSDPRPAVGSDVTFTITLTNNGPDAATDVEVLDRLPPGLGHIVSLPSQGFFDQLNGIWHVGTVPVGHTVVLNIAAEVTSSSPVTNTAMIIHSDQFDPNPNNNTASATIMPQQQPSPLPTTRDQCKNSGWMDFVGSNGQRLFRNQGDCVSFVSTGGRNGPSGP